jgi:hypothetical protein
VFPSERNQIEDVQIIEIFVVHCSTAVKVKLVPDTVHSVATTSHGSEAPGHINFNPRAISVAKHVKISIVVHKAVFVLRNPTENIYLVSDHRR